jgi:hypothetical protein
MYVNLFDIYYYSLLYYQALLSPPARERAMANSPSGKGFSSFVLEIETSAR